MLNSYLEIMNAIDSGIKKLLIDGKNAKFNEFKDSNSSKRLFEIISQ